MRKNNEMSPETITRKSAAIEDEIADLNRRLVELEQKNVDAISPDDVERYLRNMMTKIDTDDADVLQVLFENFIEGIYVTNEQIEVRLFVCFHTVKIMYNEPTECTDGYLYTQIKRPKILPYRKLK